MAHERAPTATSGPAVRVPHWLDVAAAWSWRLLLSAAGVALVVALAWYLRVVVVPVLVALAAATVLAPPARWLESKGWRPLFATLAVMLAATVVLGGIIAALVPSMSSQLSTLTEDVSRGVDDVQRWLTEGPLGLSPDQVQRYRESVGQNFQGNGGALGGLAVRGATLAFEVVVGWLLAIVLTFFFIKDGPRLMAWCCGKLPSHRRAAAQDAAEHGWRVLGAYVRGTALIGIVDATLIGVGLWIIGVPAALPLAVITFFAAFLPIVGAVIAGALAALVALVAGGPGQALLVIGLVVVVQEVEGDVLQPLVMGKALRLHPIVVLLALAVGGVAAGVLGAALAVPLVGVGVAVGSELRKHQGEDESIDLRERGADGSADTDQAGPGPPDGERNRLEGGRPLLGDDVTS